MRKTQKYIRIHINIFERSKNHFSNFFNKK